MNKHRFIRSLLLVFVTLFILAGTILPAAAELVTKPLDGKTISILGDSISTFENVSCGEASLTSNSTIHNNRLYYTDGRLGVGLNDTWWKQVIDKLGGEILVNNSYSNSSVFDPVNNAPSQAYLDRCVNLHDDTGDNSGEEPDIIIVYIGINDFAYNNAHLGTFDDIDFDELIKEEQDSITYSVPETSCEAYAIMLHKIQNRYKDAEIYCFNFPAKKGLTPELSQCFAQYNDSIKKLSDKYGCILIDLFNNIDNNENVNETFFYDGIHPNKNGMDAITNAFVDAFYSNSRYSNDSVPTYSVDYSLENVTVKNGKRYSVKENEAFYCDLTSPSGAPLSITLTIDGIDYTNEYVNKNSINIPNVTGNIVISAVEKSFAGDSYGFTVTDNVISRIEAEEFASNDTYLLNGSIDNNIINNGLIEFEKTIELKTTETWSLVWRAAFSSDNNSPIFTFNNNSSSSAEGNHYIKLDTSKNILFIGRYVSGSTLSFGIDLSGYNIDYCESHTYKLYNNLSDGKIYLYIDGKRIDSLSTYYVNDTVQNTSYNNFEIKDIFLNFIGSEEYPVTDTRIEYIKIFESDVPENHIHEYLYECVYELSCTEDERTESVCDCGHTISVITAVAEGHKESPWLTSKVATVHSSGSAYIKCEVCDKLLQSKVLPQLKPKAPQIYSISNKTNGIKIDWHTVNGADSYRVYRRGAGEGYWTYIATVTSTTYLDTTVRNNAYWRYTVRAGNEAGYGTYDNNGKYIKYVSTPHLHTIENATEGIKITWSKIYGATSYRVYRNRLGYSNWTYVGTTTSTSFVDKNIAKADGVYYKYTIRAVNGYYSDFETDTQYIKRLSTPVLTHAVHYKYGVELKWKPVVGTTGYYIYRKSGNSGWVRIGSVGGTNNTTYIDLNVTKGVKYTYTVRACYGKYLSSYNTKGVSTKK